MFVQGDITKIEVLCKDSPEFDGTPATAQVDAVVWIADPGVTPWPGLAINLVDGSGDGVVDILAADPGDLYTLATTGIMP